MKGLATLAMVGLCLSLVAGGCVTRGGEGAMATLYVSPEGNDAWTGALAAPNEDGTDGPVASLQRAQARARALKASTTRDEGVSVLVREGTYYLTEPLLFGPEDSGAPGRPTIYRAYPGERARLVGGVSATDFVPHEGEILRCETSSLASGQAFTQLFCRGERQPLARWPNKNAQGLPGGTWAYVASQVEDDPKRAFFYYGDRPRQWRRMAGCQVSIWPNYNWWQTIEEVASADVERRIVTLKKELPYTIEPGRRYFFQNLLEELDAPGEWYFDRGAGVLYFWPPCPLAPGDVTLPILDSAVMLSGVQEFVLRGFIIEGVNGDAVQVTDSERCLIAANTIRNTGGFGIAVREGRENRVVGNDVYGTGRGGIVLSGGDRKTLTAAGHEAVNNHIHDFGQLYQTYQTGVNVSGVGNRVAHNLIHDAPHIGILLGGNEHVLEFNEIHHVCMEGADNGGFYMGRDWTQRGNVLRFNAFHDIYGFGLSHLRPNAEGRYTYETPHQAWGVYLDDCSSGTTLFGNIFYRVPLCGVMIGGGRDNVVENNVFVDCVPALHIDDRWDSYCWDVMFERLEAMNYREPPYSERYPELLTMGDDPRKPEHNRFVRNIVSYSYDDFRGLSSTRRSEGAAVVYDFDQFDPDTTVIDENVIHHFGLPLRVRYTVYERKGGGTISWEEWRAKGFDAKTIVGDPGFVDAEADDYRLRKGSPALALGFERIPFDKIGLYQDEYRASWPPPSDARREGVERRVYEVQIP